MARGSNAEVVAREVFEAALRGGLRPGAAAAELLRQVEERARCRRAEVGAALRAALRGIAVAARSLSAEQLFEVEQELSVRFPGAGELLAELLREGARKLR